MMINYDYKRRLLQTQKFFLTLSELHIEQWIAKGPPHYGTVKVQKGPRLLLGIDLSVENRTVFCNVHSFYVLEVCKKSRFFGQQQISEERGKHFAQVLSEERKHLRVGGGGQEWGRYKNTKER